MQGWSDYFRNLYSFDDNPVYDSAFKEHVDSELQLFLSSEASHSYNSNVPMVSVETLTSILQTVKQNKIPWGR